jgi:catechol 2,3-dioxygenase-like lactoylglutathione lyase family enzyme
MPATTVNVRYMVDDVDAAVAWYTTHLGFTLLTNAAPAFADVALGSLRRCSGRKACRAQCPMASVRGPAAGTAFISS